MNKDQSVRAFKKRLPFSLLENWIGRCLHPDKAWRTHLPAFAVFQKNLQRDRFLKGILFLGWIALSMFVPKAFQNPVTDESSDFSAETKWEVA